MRDTGFRVKPGMTNSEKVKSEECFKILLNLDRLESKKGECDAIRRDEKRTRKGTPSFPVQGPGAYG
jgi:hypothetical protein